MAAILGLLVAGIPGLLAFSDQKGTIAKRDAAIADLEQDLLSSREKVEGHLKLIDSLRSENVDLRSKLPDAAAQEESSIIRATGAITLARKGDKADLNSTLPNFATRENYLFYDYIEYNGNEVELGSGMYLLQLNGELASFGTCASATGYSQRSEIEPHLLGSPVTCLRLNSGHYATIQVDHFDEETSDMQITVWE